jgi:hypothetical protein
MRSSIVAFLLLALVTVAELPVCVGQRSSQPSQSGAPASAESVTAPLVGDWVGVLEYRDFQSDARVQLPTWLSVRPASDANSVTLTYTYDDGPAKTVIEKSTVSIDSAAKRYTVTSDRDHSSDSYQIDGLENLAAKHRGVLVLSGAGTENDKKVDVRITVTIGRNLYKFVKETRLPGQDFLFRDGYTFTRRDPPGASPSH